MGEQDNHTQPNMYEHIDAGLRFAVMSEMILNKIGKQSGDNNGVQGPDIAAWPNKPNGYHFKLKKTLSRDFLYTATVYTLEHYVDELPNVPLTRYAVMSMSWQVSAIVIVDRAGQPRRDSRQGKEAARQALAIMTETAGREGKEVLERIFDNRFEEMIGRYVLSNLAVRADGEPPVPAMSNKLAETALVEHLLRDIEICEEESVRSNESDPVAKQSFVSDAINEDPAPRRRGRYKQINIIQTVKNVAAQLPKGWQNTVTPDQ